MIRSGWRYILAALVGLSLLSASSPKIQRQDTQLNAYQTLRGGEPVAPATEDLSKVDDEKLPCEPGEENRKSDLCAQWKAADAAADAALWTQRAFWIALGSLPLSIATLIATYFAAKGAWDAARYTAKAAEEATTANEIAKASAKEQDRALELADRSTRAAENSAEAARMSVIQNLEIGKKQLRAYLIFDTKNVEFILCKSDYSNLLIRLTIKNFGQSTARNVNVSCNISAFYNGQSMANEFWKNPLARNENEILSMIGPGAEEKHAWALTLPGTINSNGPNLGIKRKEITIKDLPVNISVDVLFSYIDIFDEVRTQFFRAYCQIDKIETFVKSKIILLDHDPQGAADIYPLP